MKDTIAKAYGKALVSERRVTATILALAIGSHDGLRWSALAKETWRFIGATK